MAAEMKFGADAVPRVTTLLRAALVAALVLRTAGHPALRSLRHSRLAEETKTSVPIHRHLAQRVAAVSRAPKHPEFFHEGHGSSPGPHQPSGHLTLSSREVYPYPGGAGRVAENRPKSACHPKCWWSCGNTDCDEVCEPVCAPPQCETACAPINPAACAQRCDPPQCAIVCPSMHCDHGDCPRCKTVCGPPKCETVCSEQCESRCAEPSCTWKCDPGKCEQPKCNLECGGAQMCGFNADLNARPAPFKHNMRVLSKGLAAFDPHSLAAAANATGGGDPSWPWPPAPAAAPSGAAAPDGADPLSEVEPLDGEEPTTAEEPATEEAE